MTEFYPYLSAFFLGTAFGVSISAGLIFFATRRMNRRYKELFDYITKKDGLK